MHPFRTAAIAVSASAAALAVTATAASASTAAASASRSVASCRIAPGETAAGKYPFCNASGTVSRPAGLQLHVRVNREAAIEKALAPASHGGFGFTASWGETCAYGGHEETLRSGRIMVSPSGTDLRVPFPGKGAPSSCQVTTGVTTTVALTPAMIKALRKAGVSRISGSATITARSR